MSALTIPASPRRQITSDVVRRQHSRSATFSAPFAAPRELLPQSEVRSRSAYYSVIAGAVSRLPNNTRDARLALYDRAETALTAELLRHPEISDEQVAVERLALERAFLKIEGDARKKEEPKQLKQERRRTFAAFLSFFGPFNP